MKSATIIAAIQEHWGEVFVYSDVDVVFFAPTKAAILESIADKDIVCQRDDPLGSLCTGFFGIRANETTLQLWQAVRQSIEREGRDQVAFNRLARERTDLRAGYLPASFFGTGTFAGRRVQGTERFYVPLDPAMFHANWTIGVDSKIALLSRAQAIVDGGSWSRGVNNFFFRLQPGNKRRPAVDALVEQDRALHPSGVRRPASARGDFSRPRRVALDVSTVCQLKCPSCPTANGTIARSIGAGFLTLANFRKLVRDHPWVSDIELSNWGEVFLNRDLEPILRHAYQQHVAVRIDNGANLDRASERVLEALVKYRLRSLTCSIDGAGPDTYAVYRVNGNFDRVIGHVRQINAFKQRYRSRYPALRWQFGVFDHNAHEIGKARDMARELGMQFHPKLSWDDLYTEVVEAAHQFRRPAPRLFHQPLGRLRQRLHQRIGERARLGQGPANQRDVAGAPERGGRLSVSTMPGLSQHAPEQRVGQAGGAPRRPRGRPHERRPAWVARTTS